MLRVLWVRFCIPSQMVQYQNTLLGWLWFQKSGFGNLTKRKNKWKKIIIIIIIILIWNLKLHFGLKKCWTKWALKQLKKYKSLGYIIKFSILTKKKEKSAYKYGIGLKGKKKILGNCFLLNKTLLGNLVLAIWKWYKKKPKVFIYLFIYIYIIKPKPLTICWPHESLLHRI